MKISHGFIIKQNKTSVLGTHLNHTYPRLDVGARTDLETDWSFSLGNTPSLGKDVNQCVARNGAHQPRQGELLTVDLLALETENSGAGVGGSFLIAQV